MRTVLIDEQPTTALGRIVRKIEVTLTSRKFQAAVVASIPFAMTEQWDKFAQVWMAYAGVQGVVDAAERFKKG